MDELLVASAKLMPEEALLKELTEALEKYKVFRTKESKAKLVLFCMLLVTRYSTDDESVSETLKRFTEAREISNLFKNKKN